MTIQTIHHFLDPFSLLHLDLKHLRDSISHKVLQICKQSTQIASIYLNAFRSNSIESEMISFEDCAKMAVAKLKDFILG